MIPVSHLISKPKRRRRDMPLGTGDWRLVFSDDFDGDSLDTKKWTPRRGYGYNTFGTPFNKNDEMAGFQPEQVSVSDGMLHLTGTSVPTVVNDEWGMDYEYPCTSGVVNSEEGFQFKYGYVEARMLVPSNVLFWPAFWMVAPGINLPEIDIAEYFLSGWDGCYHPYLNLHWGSDWNHHEEHGMQMIGKPGQDFGQEWHTHGLLWRPGLLQAFLDGKPGPVITGDRVPDVEMFMILNLSIRKNENVFPQTQSMLVDHVRVWQEKPASRIRRYHSRSQNVR